MKKYFTILAVLLVISCSDVKETPNTNNNHQAVLDEAIISNDDQLSTQSSIAVGDTLSLSVTSIDPFATISWSTRAGTFDDATSASVVWTPPNIDIARKFTLDVTVTLENGNYDTASIDIVVYKIGGGFTIETLFADGSWEEPGAELCALSYDPSSDNLFIIKCASAGNKVLRYNFNTQMVQTVHTYTSQYDYGARVINGELYIARSYDKTVLRLSNLSANNLTEVANYGSATAMPELTEINDMTIVNSNIYFVAGNMLTSDHHNGIQYLLEPDYASVVELLSSIDANWQNNSFAYYRSIITTFDGINDYLVINTGSRDGVIELRDLTGKFITQRSGLGGGILQKDSQDRIYKAFNGNLIRWNADMSSEQTVNLTPSINSNDLFILRERGAQIEVISAPFRSQNPVFSKSVITQ